MRVNRTATVSVLALTAALALAGVAGADGDPARVDDPIEATDAQAALAGGTAVLENGTTDLSVRVEEGSVAVWTKRMQCLQRDESTCAEGSAETTRGSLQVNDSVTIGPRGDDTQPRTGLVADEAATLDVEADAQAWNVATANETRTFADDPQAPDEMRELVLERGPRLSVAEPTITVEGDVELSTVDTEVHVDGVSDPLVTGWSWEEGEDVPWYRTLRLVLVDVSGEAALAWDGDAQVAADTPVGLQAGQATLDVFEGEVAGVNASAAPATVSDVSVTVAGADWNLSSQDVNEGTPTLNGAQQSGEADTWFEVQDEAVEPAVPPDSEDASAARTFALASGATLAAAMLVGYYWPRLAYAGTLLVSPLYSRIGKDEMLEHEVRETLYETVKEDPGIHAHALSEAADVGWGTTVYHLRRLEDSGFVTSEKKGRYRRFFPAGGFQEEHREVLSVLQNETTEAVARAVLDDPGLNQSAICDRVDISPSLASWHLDQLIEADLVDRERRGRTVHYTPGPAWDRIQGFVDLDGPSAPASAGATA